MATQKIHALSSWKEIAHYVGKGVRTVQRWEQEFGFPVRRPRPHGLLVAYPGEIDAWLRSGGSSQAKRSNGALRKEVEELRAENRRLRQELETALQQSAPRLANRLAFDHVEASLRTNRTERQRCAQLTDDLVTRCINLVHASNIAQQQCAATIDASRQLRALRPMGIGPSKANGAAE